ncbi:hypothetical protein TYRP_019066 [Tyrophagus putrescentiae]|nr:hypothetical protein TYRP_019066 [Tyrophagus putrescentiae]
MHSLFDQWLRKLAPIAPYRGRDTPLRHCDRVGPRDFGSQDGHTASTATFSTITAAITKWQADKPIDYKQTPKRSTNGWSSKTVLKHATKKALRPSKRRRAKVGEGGSHSQSSNLDHTRYTF